MGEIIERGCDIKNSRRKLSVKGVETMIKGNRIASKWRTYQNEYTVVQNQDSRRQ